MSMQRQTMLFGAYPLACAIYQFCVYMRPNGMGSIFDPRFGWALFARDDAKFERIAWASAAWLLCLAAGFVFGPRKRLLMLPPLSEFLLAAPTAVYVLVSLCSGAGHLTLTGDGLLSAIGLFILFTLIPVVLSILLAVRSKKVANNPDKP